MKARVLIVDDAPFVREMLTQLISKSGFEIVGEAQDGNEAIALCAELLPDIVFLDIILPHKNGIQVAMEIARSHPAIRIIATSSGDNEVLIQKAIEAGCCDFVAKPFSVDAVMGALNKSIEIDKSGRKTS